MSEQEQINGILFVDSEAVDVVALSKTPLLEGEPNGIIIIPIYTAGRPVSECVMSATVEQLREWLRIVEQSTDKGKA